MAKVTIEGSLTPSAFLPRGERVTVQRTDRIDQLVYKGFVVVVDAHGETEPAPLPDPPKAPAKNASAEKWREFLDDQGVVYDPDANREELSDAWDAHQAAGQVVADAE